MLESGTAGIQTRSVLAQRLYTNVMSGIITHCWVYLAVLARPKSLLVLNAFSFSYLQLKYEYGYGSKFKMELFLTP